MASLRILFVAIVIFFGGISLDIGRAVGYPDTFSTQVFARPTGRAGRKTAFLTYNGQRVRLDIYLPEAENPPVAILIHGAAGIEGDRAQRYERFANDLVNRGIAAVNVHYFNSPRSHWVRTIQETINYTLSLPKVNQDRIALIGYSLGGTLATVASLNSDRVKVLVINSGALPNNFSQEDAQKLPYHIYMACGTEDFCYPSLQRLNRMAQDSGKSFTKRVRGGGHTISIDAFWQEWQDILNFTASRLK